MSSANSFSLSMLPGSRLRYARYVGRVGALAVALGVGFAVASTQGVAHATPSTDATAPSNTPGSTNPSTASQNSNGASEQRQSRKHDARRTPGSFGGGNRTSDRSGSGHEKPRATGGTDDGSKDRERGIDTGPVTGNAVGDDAATASKDSTRSDSQPGTSARRSLRDVVQKSVSRRQITAISTPERSAPVAASDPHTPRVPARVETAIRSQVRR